MGIKEVLRRKVARYALEALVRFPQTVDEPLIQLVLEKIWRKKTPSIRQMVASMKRLSENTNKNCQERLLENLVLEGLIENQKIRDEGKRQGLSPLHTILISPTMRCNLNCSGCYSKNYQKKDDLPLIEDLKDDLDKYSQEVHRIYTPVWEAWEKQKREFV